MKNEPQNSNPSYPTNLIDPYWEGQVATQLRSLMNENGFSDTIIIGYDHNWDDAGEYPVELVRPAHFIVFMGIATCNMYVADGGCGGGV